MTTTNAQTQALQKEFIKSEPFIPQLLEVDMPLFRALEKTDSDPVSSRSTRISLLRAIKGTFQRANMDNADLGSTSGPEWIVATLAPNYYTFGVSLSSQAIFATDSERKAVDNPFQQTLRLAAKQFRSALDMLMNTGGNGVLGTITSVSTNTFTLTTDGFKEELFYEGMPVQVFNAALTTDRGSSTVTAIDRDAHTITVALAPGGTVATDLLVIEGLSAPVTIQSDLFGVQYQQSDAATGLKLNLDLATTPQMRTPSVNATSSTLTTAHIRRALEKIREAVGDEALENGSAQLVAYMHGAQADQYEAGAITISQIIKEGSANQAVDRLFANQGGMPRMKMAGVPVMKSIHADRTRIDFLCLKWWGRIVATDTGYYKNPLTGDYLHPKYNSAGDGLVSAWFFYLKTGLQLYNRNPLCGALIKNLVVPALY